MKTKLFIVAFLCCCLCSCLCSCNKDHSDSTEKVYDFPLTRQDALEIVSPITDTCKVVMAGKTIFAPSSLILSVPGVERLYSPDCQTWMIIADTDPSLEGGNHYRYLFVDINTGKVVNILQAWLPDFFLDRIKWMGKDGFDFIN